MLRILQLIRDVLITVKLEGAGAGGGAGTQLHEAEIMSIMPYLVDRCGHKSDRHKQAFIACMDVAKNVIPPARMVALLSSGLSCKNKRTRTVCLEQMCLLVESHGHTIFGRAGLKEVGTFLDSKDNDVSGRNACLELCYQLFRSLGGGENSLLTNSNSNSANSANSANSVSDNCLPKLVKQLGGLSERATSGIEDRIKQKQREISKKQNPNFDIDCITDTPPTKAKKNSSRSNNSHSADKNDKNGKNDKRQLKAEKEKEQEQEQYESGSPEVSPFKLEMTPPTTPKGARPKSDKGSKAANTNANTNTNTNTQANENENENALEINSESAEDAGGLSGAFAHMALSPELTPPHYKKDLDISVRTTLTKRTPPPSQMKTKPSPSSSPVRMAALAFNPMGLVLGDVDDKVTYRSRLDRLDNNRSKSRPRSNSNNPNANANANAAVAVLGAESDSEGSDGSDTEAELTEQEKSMQEEIDFLKTKLTALSVSSSSADSSPPNVKSKPSKSGNLHEAAKIVPATNQTQAHSQTNTNTNTNTLSRSYVERSTDASVDVSVCSEGGEELDDIFVEIKGKMDALLEAKSYSYDNTDTDTDTYTDRTHMDCTDYIKILLSIASGEWTQEEALPEDEQLLSAHSDGLLLRLVKCLDRAFTYVPYNNINITINSSNSSSNNKDTDCLDIDKDIDTDKDIDVDIDIDISLASAAMATIQALLKRPSSNRALSTPTVAALLSSTLGHLVDERLATPTPPPPTTTTTTTTAGTERESDKDYTRKQISKALNLVAITAAKGRPSLEIITVLTYFLNQCSAPRSMSMSMSTVPPLASKPACKLLRKVCADEDKVLSPFNHSGIGAAVVAMAHLCETLKVRVYVCKCMYACRWCIYIYNIYMCVCAF